MANFNCFKLIGRKKKEGEEISKTSNKNGKVLKVTVEHPAKSSESDGLKITSFDVVVPSGVVSNSECNVNIVSRESPTGGETTDVAYEGEDEHEHEEDSLIKRNLSDFDLEASGANVEDKLHSFELDMNENSEDKSETPMGADLIQSGHVSDPGIRKVEFWASPMLQRSCSSLETRQVLRNIVDQLPPSKSQSYEELQELANGMRELVDPGTPKSVVSHLSADRVMLRKQSSSQVLPSGSRKLWWKLFLWSHRNVQKPQTVKPRPVPEPAVFNQQGGYCSDTLEPTFALKSGKMESPGSFTGESEHQFQFDMNNDNQIWDGFRGSSRLWPQNQWVAFPMPTESSPFKRVDEWVKDLEIAPPVPADNDEISDEDIFYPPSPEAVRSPDRNGSHLNRHRDNNLSEEILHANNVIQSLNSSSTVAHISGIGLKVVPNISPYSSLKSVNLSNNSIVRITPGSLPKGLHILNLSRNKISTIEGLRELTRLRALDLSYNRISRIGHGLSNCTLIKELYLAGNKISDVEGLHRLLKLTVLDLSFNKITTTKGLGQLVANYNSLQALNLLGNPVQSNVSDDQLRKAVCSLLPKLAYLNKQPIKQQRAREVLKDSVAKAALGSGSRSSRRKATTRRVSRGGSVVSSSVYRSGTSAAQKGKDKLKNLSRHQFVQKTGSSAHASSSR